MLLYEKKTDDLYVIRVEAFDFLPHVHQHIEIAVCLAGEFDVTCNRIQKTLARGDMMVVFPHEIHSYQVKEGGRGMIAIVSPELFPWLSAKTDGKRFENFWIGAGEQPALWAEALYREFTQEQPREIQLGYLYLLLGNALAALPVCKGERRIAAETFSRVMEYLSEHYTEPLTLGALAARFHVDPCHLSRLFTQKLGCGYLQYLHELRVEHAKRLLRSSDLSISEIIDRSGFADQKTFNRVFKEVSGMTPRQFRQCPTLH